MAEYIRQKDIQPVCSTNEAREYFSNCGRPLTPEAWEELRKRLEALNNDKK